MAEWKIDITEMVERTIDKIITDGYFVSKWIPCSERMPENYKNVLLYGKKIGILKGFFTAYKDLYIADSGNTGVRKYAVTHWMPLPDPPEEVQHDA